MYIYDLPEGLSTNAKAIAGDTILFSVDIATSANNHNKDLRIISYPLICTHASGGREC